jgi:hypothetical protein
MPDKAADLPQDARLSSLICRYQRLIPMGKRGR